MPTNNDATGKSTLPSYTLPGVPPLQGWTPPTNTNPFAQQPLNIQPSRTFDDTSNYTRPTWARVPMMWELYDGTFIEMYVNPQSVTMQANKKIQATRTKGGFMVQYWGDELVVMNISGTTGSSGIEGIEILYDLFQSELLPPKRLDELSYNFAASPNAQAANEVASKNKVNQFSNKDLARRADLVSRATNVVLWYGTKRYYGFFTSFGVTELASSPGEYTYQMTYTIWKTVGRDKNYMPWHRTPAPLSNGLSGVPENDGNVSIYEIQSGI